MSAYVAFPRIRFGGRKDEQYWSLRVQRIILIQQHEQPEKTEKESTKQNQWKDVHAFSRFRSSPNAPHQILNRRRAALISAVQEVRSEGWKCWEKFHTFSTTLQQNLYYRLCCAYKRKYVWNVLKVEFVRFLNYKSNGMWHFYSWKCNCNQLIVVYSKPRRSVSQNNANSSYAHKDKSDKLWKINAYMYILIIKQ